MHLKTILDRVQKFKSFVYKSIRWVENKKLPELEIEVVERINAKAIFSECGFQRPGYDRLPPDALRLCFCRESRYF
jgi:hypothetical protein